MSTEHESAVFDQLASIGLVPVVTMYTSGDASDQAARLGAALLAGGLPCAEITLRTESALGAIRAMTAAHPDMLVGAGTVRTVEQAQDAVDAGSRFVVTPGYDDAVVQWCRAHGVPVAPGVMTPTEINMALRQDLRFLKFFPAATAGGVAALTAFAGAYPDVRFMPTGGIDAGNLADYLRLPIVAACGGSWVTAGPLDSRVDYTRIEQRAADAVAIVRRTRSEQ